MPKENKKKLFCEISPLTYKISWARLCLLRNIKDFSGKEQFAKEKSIAKLPVSLYKHKSLIRRGLGNINMDLQENKALNLAIAAPKVNGVIIKPGETFSFWKLVGKPSAKSGYREGLTIKSGAPSSGTGGGMCQFTNLLHWLALHSPLDITERNHHNGLDLFPDYGRQVPFGCGTSILYNYLDYRLKNNTENIFQIIVYTDQTHLCGELLSNAALPLAYHIQETDREFIKADGVWRRRNKVYRNIVDKRSGKTVSRELISQANAKVCYDESFMPQ
ncbi:MAG: VanW family protein [Oscillospiraceae bacterium]|jgi:vancomycin resistance protein VanW|nr:VanW family protein [Oscillospiraceae bacterium]